MMRLVQSIRRLMRESSKNSLTRGARRLSKGFPVRVEGLEGRSLLSHILTDFPIQPPTGDGSDWVESLTTAPSGDIYFTTEIGADTKHPATEIGKIASSGSITWFPIINDLNVANLTAAQDGSILFSTSTDIGKITPSGALTLFPAPAIASNITGLTEGPDGNVWFTSSSPAYGPSAPLVSVVGRMTPAGQIATFPILAGPLADQVVTGPIVEAKDGSLWFAMTVPLGTQNASEMNLLELEVASVTTAGQITLHRIARLSQSGEDASAGFDFARGPDGEPWLAVTTLLKPDGDWLPPEILRIEPSGHFRRFPIPVASDRLLGGLVSAPGEGLYFTITDANYDDGPDPQTTIGRLFMSGRVSFAALPQATIYPLAVTPGRDGSLWYGGGLGIVRIETH